MNKPVIFQKIDEEIFKKIDELKSHPEYQKIADSYSNLEEEVQELIKFCLMLLVTLIPLVIFFIFYSSNSSLKENLQTKDKLIHVANNLIQKKAIISSEERKILGPSYIGDDNTLKQKVTSLLSMSSVNTSKIQINNFDSQALDGYITKVQSNISFQDLTSNELFATLSALSGRGKMKIDEISLRKSESDNLLDGALTVVYYSKEIVNEL